MMLQGWFEGYFYNVLDTNSFSKLKEKDINFRVNDESMSIHVVSRETDTSEYVIDLFINHETIQGIKSLITYMEAVYIKGDDE